MHAILVDEILEVKCANSRCGARSGVVVLHQFDLKTGELIRTEKYRDPVLRRR